MPGWEDPTTGLVRPDGPDYVSDIPAIERDFLRRLAPMLRRNYASRSDVESSYQRLGLNDAPIASVPSDGTEYRWDGKQWLAFDYRMRRYTPVWYAGSDLKVQSIGSGTIEAVYRRNGPTMWWRIRLTRAGDGSGSGDTNLGVGYYSWYLPLPVRNSQQTGTGYVRAKGIEYPGSVVFRDPQRPTLVIAKGNTTERVGTDSFNWADGDEIVLTGECELGGLS